MVSKNASVVTGGFGYSGRYIARRLLDAGAEVRMLTNAPDSQSPFGSRVRAIPFSLGDHARLVEALKGAAVLYNTYWVRFNHAKFRQVDAVRNTLALFRAARAAGRPSQHHEPFGTFAAGVFPQQGTVAHVL